VNLIESQELDPAHHRFVTGLIVHLVESSLLLGSVLSTERKREQVEQINPDCSDSNSSTKTSTFLSHDVNPSFHVQPYVTSCHLKPP
jgi:hypothetical protein